MKKGRFFSALAGELGLLRVASCRLGSTDVGDAGLARGGKTAAKPEVC